MTREEKGEMAHMGNIIGAQALSDLVKTTLGPKGMDKILQPQSGEGAIEITNDGATILRSILVENPAAKILIDISKTQDEEAGDGTTSVCVLAGELLREAESLLLQRIHPMTVIQGYMDAAAIAYNALLESSIDNSSDAQKFKNDLLNIARTTLSSKILTQEKNLFAELAVEAVLRLKGSGNLDAIKILKKPGGTMKDSFLADGFILNKQFGIGQPRRVENAKILVANTAMDTDKIKIYGAKVKTNSMAKLAEIEAAEKKKMRDKCEKIANHGCTIFINRQLIYDAPQEFFTERGIVSIEHADFEGVERLALVLGADIVSTFDHPEQVKLGTCDVVEEIMIGEEKLIKFSGCERNEACTIVLRGASTHILEEAERSLHDALCVLAGAVKESRIVLGGGCSEMLMAKAVDAAAKKTEGKKSIAMEAYARALKQIPTIIANNAGLDSAELVANLESAHYNGKSTYGVDVIRGEMGDMAELGITEAFKVKGSVVQSASEAAEMILRVDSVITAAPRQRG